MTKVYPSDRNGTYSNLTLFLIGRKILKYFNDFYKLALFNFIAKLIVKK